MADPYEKERFGRQMLLPEVGFEGQGRLQRAKIFLLGSGGLASSAAYYLAAAGIGTIGIADDDRVDLSNLNRQILHQTSRIGMFKVDSAEATLRALCPSIEVKAYRRRLASSEALIEVVTDYDLVLDCTDNYTARFHLNTACLQAAKPWIYAAVSGFEGQTMTIIPSQGPCYQCLYPSAPAATDTVVPVMGVTAGIMGIIQATEALKHILGIGRPLVGRMLFVDLLEMSVSEFNISRNVECPACGTR